MYVKISDYFNNAQSSYNKKEWLEINRIRNRINSLEYEDDIYNLIDNRRKSSSNKANDFKLFGIPATYSVDLKSAAGKNEYYDTYSGDGYGTWSKDSDGNFINPNSKKGAIKSSKMSRNLSNIAYNVKNNKVSNFIKFVANNIHLIFYISVGIFISIVVLYFLIFLIGISSSLGQTPFSLCGGSGSNVKWNYTEDVEVMATPEYSINTLVYLAKKRGWKDNAIIGCISYILTEGSGMGSFTYEMYYLDGFYGPSGVSRDKTLDNQAWLNWLYKTSGDNYECSCGAKTSFVTQYEIHQKYYCENSKSNFMAFGIGLMQYSDVSKYNTGNRAGGQAENMGGKFTELILSATEAGVYWQDPQFQIDLLLNDIETRDDSDLNDVNPMSMDLTSYEWARRITAGIGMPGWSWDDTDSSRVEYLDAHTAGLPKAAKYLIDFTGDSGYAGVGGAPDKCNTLSIESIKAGNSSIQEAAVSIASAYNLDYSDPFYDTYKKITSNINGDGDYNTESAAVSTAILWSGTDDSFPVSSIQTQYEYLNSSESTGKWKYIGIYGGVYLQPGDLLITPLDSQAMSTMLYVGSDNVKTKYPESDADMYKTINSSPGLYDSSPEMEPLKYEVYRNIAPQDSDKYKGAHK